MVERQVTEKAPYAYAQSGLDNVFLVGIKVRECPKCHMAEPNIPGIGDLNNLISQWLIGKAGRLRGCELRFLRKNAGYSAKDFALLLGVEPSHLSRVENGVVECLGDSNDHHARLLAKVALDKAEKEYLDKLLEKLEKKPKSPKWSIQTFAFKGECWKIQKAA